MITALVVGLGTGVVASLATWWLTARAIGPKVKFAPEISKRPEPDGLRWVWNYRCKFRNVPRWLLPDRPIVEVDVSAALCVRGLRPGSTSIDRIPISIGNREVIPYVEESRVLRLRLESIFTGRLPADIQPRVEAGTIELEELLDLGSEAWVEVVVSAAHGYSHARATFVHSFFASDVRCGSFEGMSVAEDPGLCERHRAVLEARASSDRRATWTTRLSRLLGVSGTRRPQELQPPEGFSRT